MKVQDRFLEDLDWAGEHHTELLAKYRDQWVAVCDRQIVAHRISITKVRKTAQVKTGNKHIPLYFVDSSSNIYIWNT